MTLAKQIVQTALEYAYAWKQQNCVEDNTACYKYLFEQDYNKVIGNPWCAALVSKILKRAFALQGYTYPVQFTMSTQTLLDEAKRLKISVNTTPAIGSVFYYSRGGGQGHVGVVIGGDSTGIYTVEGNVSDALKCYGCTDKNVALIGTKTLRSYSNMQKLGAVYLHFEELEAATPKTDTGIGIGVIAGVLLLGAGVWYASNS